MKPIALVFGLIVLAATVMAGAAPAHAASCGTVSPSSIDFGTSQPSSPFVLRTISFTNLAAEPLVLGASLTNLVVPPPGPVIDAGKFSWNIAQPTPIQPGETRDVVFPWYRPASYPFVSEGRVDVFVGPPRGSGSTLVCDTHEVPLIARTDYAPPVVPEVGTVALLGASGLVAVMAVLGFNRRRRQAAY